MESMRAKFFPIGQRAALEEPRFADRQQLGCKIVIESRVTPATVEALSKMGCAASA